MAKNNFSDYDGYEYVANDDSETELFFEDKLQKRTKKKKYDRRIRQAIEDFIDHKKLKNLDSYYE